MNKVTFRIHCKGHALSEKKPLFNIYVTRFYAGLFTLITVCGVIYIDVLRAKSVTIINNKQIYLKIGRDVTQLLYKYTCNCVN